MLQIYHVLYIGPIRPKLRNIVRLLNASRFRVVYVSVSITDPLVEDVLYHLPLGVASLS